MYTNIQVSAEGDIKHSSILTIISLDALSSLEKLIHLTMVELLRHHPSEDKVIILHQWLHFLTIMPLLDCHIEIPLSLFNEFISGRVENYNSSECSLNGLESFPEGGPFDSRGRCCDSYSIGS